MKINLVIVQPEQYVHSLGFLDTAMYLRYWFETLGHQVLIGKNRLRHDSVNIIFGAHLGMYPSWIDSNFCTFIFNLEQIGQGGANITDAYSQLLRSAPVIDYHAENICNYRPDSWREVPLVPFWNAPYLNRDSLALDLSQRPIDLLFFGSVNAERKTFLKRIERAGWDVAVFDSPTYFEERDEYVRQAKAVVNMSYYASARFEQVRAFNVLSQGTAFISYLLPTQSIPNDFIDPVFWINENNFDKFFSEEFSKPKWFQLAAEKYLSWIGTDPRPAFNKLLSTLELEWSKHLQSMSVSPANPVQMVQFDDGSYFQDAVNVSPHEYNDPDLPINLLEPQDWPWVGLSKRGQFLQLELGQLERIVIHDNPLGSHQWCALMTNAMELLCEAGLLVLELPVAEVILLESSCRVPNAETTLLIFTEKFWRSGQLSHRFDLKAFQTLNDQRQPVDGSIATTCQVIFEKRSTTPRERTLARVHLPDFGIGK
jgi:hypothetical protein